MHDPSDAQDDFSVGFLSFLEIQYSDLLLTCALFYTRSLAHAPQFFGTNLRRFILVSETQSLCLLASIPHILNSQAFLQFNLL